MSNCQQELILEEQMISPTLAEFFNVPFFTKMSQEDIVLALWNYIIKNNFLIDDRLILLDKILEPVMHPFFLWKGNNEHIEHTIVMVYIAKMHVDPDFIQQDIDSRLLRIRKNMAARRLLRLLSYKRSKVSPLEISKDGNIDIPVVSPWVKYLATHYGK